MKFIDAVGLEKADLLGCHDSCDHATDLRIVLGAVKHVAEPPRNGCMHIAENLAACAKFEIGMMPGTIGAVCRGKASFKEAEDRSRCRKNTA